jgi:hypothetical protein
MIYIYYIYIYMIYIYDIYIIYENIYIYEKCIEVYTEELYPLLWLVPL